MNASFERFADSALQKGLLKKEKVAFSQVVLLLKKAHKNLKAAKANLSIDESVAFVTAYTAMLETARAFLLLNGYRPTGRGEHRTSVEAVGFLLGGDFRELIRDFNRMRRKRHEVIYEPAGLVSRQETERSLDIADEFLKKVVGLMKQKHPQEEFPF